MLTIVFVGKDEVGERCRREEKRRGCLYARVYLIRSVRGLFSLGVRTSHQPDLCRTVSMAVQLRKRALSDYRLSHRHSDNCRPATPLPPCHRHRLAQLGTLFLRLSVMSTDADLIGWLLASCS